ncbi:MAG: serine/threonine-protein kinase [Leptolyngbyaceae cyanobacterium bins.59]|nr:serine/threonine-protein kinase [Leptolyngbyaceae cyanobacterium bins.59]
MYEPGQVLGNRYELQERLGNTAAGRQTWLAKDLQDGAGEQVILKLLAFGLAVGWQELELFEREAKILQALDHDRIPCYRDYFAIDAEGSNALSWFALVQDYIPGESLQSLLEKGMHFSQGDVQRIGKHLLTILQYLHELSPPVLHRDIKPSNVILGQDRQVYLVDFGAVQDKAATTGVSFTVVGTTGYAPLEQFYGRAVPASDLYALGATLIHLLTGVPPSELMQDDGSLGFMDRVNLDPEILSSQWLQQLVELDLRRRFKSAREALAALQRSPWTHKSAHPQPTQRQQLAPAHQSQTFGIAEQKKIARLELENELLRLDHSWSQEQEQHKVKRSKYSAPELPTKPSKILLGFLLTLVLGGGIVGCIYFSIPFSSNVVGVLFILTCVVVGSYVVEWYRYTNYQAALISYERQRESAIAHYERKLQELPDR